MKMLIAAAFTLITAIHGPAAGAAEFREVSGSQRSGGTATKSHAPRPWLVKASRRWMSYLPDDTPLSAISIPGTHDSAADINDPFVTTQSWTLPEQMLAGIRYLDIRLKAKMDLKKKILEGADGGYFAVHHGEVWLFRNFDSVLKEVQAFLRANPSETVLMRVKRCCKPDKGAPGFEKIWKGYQRRYPHLFVNALHGMPTLGQLRGKVLVLRNAEFGDDPAVGMPYDSKEWTTIQDKYTVSSNGDLKDKFNRLRDQMTRAADTPRLTLNHASATGARGLKGDNLLEKTGDVFVMGKEAVQFTPWSVARRTNQIAYDRAQDFKGRRPLGVLIMDFPGEELIYRWIGSNFEPKAYCTARKYRVQSAGTWAEFRMPKARAGDVVRINKGSYHKARKLTNIFGKSKGLCDRVKWTDLKFSCGANGKWSYTGRWDSDGLCSTKNAGQHHLYVGNL